MPLLYDTVVQSDMILSRGSQTDTDPDEDTTKKEGTADEADAQEQGFVVHGGGGSVSESETTALPCPFDACTSTLMDLSSFMPVVSC